MTFPSLVRLLTKHKFPLFVDSPTVECHRSWKGGMRMSFGSVRWSWSRFMLPALGVAGRWERTLSSIDFAINLCHGRTKPHRQGDQQWRYWAMSFPARNDGVAADKAVDKVPLITPSRKHNLTNKNFYLRVEFRRRVIRSGINHREAGKATCA